MASKKQKPACRVLLAFVHGEKSYKPNDVVVFSENDAKRLAKDGFVDTTPAAIEFCINAGGVLVYHDDELSDEQEEPINDSQPQLIPPP